MNKRYFSLVEIVVVIAIIALIGGGLGMHFAKNIKNHRFKSHISQVEAALQFAKEIAFSNQIDVTFCIEPDADHLGDMKGFFITDEPEYTLKGALNKVYKFSSLYLFKDEKLVNQTIKFLFSSSGYIDAEENIYLSSDKKGEKRHKIVVKNL